MKQRLQLFLHSGLPLLASLSIYLLCRPRDIVVNQIAFQFFDTPPERLLLPGLNWLVYNLPGALWLYAFLSFSTLFRSRFLTLLPLCLALGIELVQLLKITDGIYDQLDVFFYLLAWAAFNLSGQRQPNDGVMPLPNIPRRYKVAFVFFIMIVFLSDVAHR